MPYRQRLNQILARWQALFGIAFHPYRPELHYMRGPGPKWRAKHQSKNPSKHPSSAGT
jgi:hypothetical protein